MRYDAAAFLAGLFPADGHPGRHPPAVIPEDLPPDWHLAWDERAAVMEFDGGLPRERAEALALTDILKQMANHPEDLS